MGEDEIALSSPALRFRHMDTNYDSLAQTQTVSSMPKCKNVFYFNKKSKSFPYSRLQKPQPITILLLLLVSTMPTTANELLCPQFCQCSNPSTYTTGPKPQPSSLSSVNCSNQNLEEFNVVFRTVYAQSVIENNNSAPPLVILGQHHLHVLDFSNNRLSDVQLAGAADTSANNGSWVIDSVDLSHNSISGFEVDVTCPFRVLLSLDLSFNRLESLSDLVWARCPGLLFLQNINLSYNAIGELDNASLSSLVFLQSLDLSFNRLQTVSGSAFEGLISLRYLYMNGNNLQRITNVFPSLPNVILINFSNNNLESFPKNTYFSLSSLQKLDLTKNNITYLDINVFKGLINLVQLSLDQNPLTSLEAPVFQTVSSLQSLSLCDMPHLGKLGYLAFSGLSHLISLNLSHNQQLHFLHPNALSALTSLQVLDLSYSGFQQLSSITFHNQNLHKVFLRELPLLCNCTNAWLQEESLKNESIFVGITAIQCFYDNNQSDKLTVADFNCGEVSIGNTTQNADVRLGSQLMLQCQQESVGKAVLKWTTPSGQEFYQHDFHPEALLHLLTPEDVQPDANFHKGHYWHHSSSYHDEISSNTDRIVILSDGSLFIDYMLRQDAGDYTCEVKNVHYNHSITVTIHLDYEISGRIKIFAYVVGFLSALGLFTLNVVCVVISWTARHVVNKRRREIIHQMLESLNAYKSTHVTRIHENYLHQLSRVRNQYHIQRDRLHKNYTLQVARVKRGCSNQVERVRDNYNSKLNQLREYSSRQIVQIRESANNQIARIRDYGSLQLERLRETYKLQQQHVLKLLDTMNLDNCRSVVETECMRTESMMFDIDLLETDDRVESPISPESDYNTAASSPDMSDGLTADMEDNRSDDRELYDEMPEENDKMGSDDHEIQMEMVSHLCLPNGVHLEAKEVWTTHGDEDNDEDHTLYINIHDPDLEMQASSRPWPNRPKKHCSSIPYGRDTQNSHDAKAELAPLPLHTVSLYPQILQERTVPELPGSPANNSNEETWSGNYMTPEASPIKLQPQGDCLNDSYKVSLKNITPEEDKEEGEDYESRL